MPDHDPEATGLARAFLRMAAELKRLGQEQKTVAAVTFAGTPATTADQQDPKGPHLLEE